MTVSVLGGAPTLPASGASGGRAELRFERAPGGRTYLAGQYVEYPYHVTRPLYLEPSWPELPMLCVQSASGGLFQGDRLRLTAALGQEAAVQVTTQSATKAHGMQRDHAVQSADLALGPGSYLEYLADPLILFPSARVLASVAVRLSEDSSAIVRESFLHHDPAGSREAAFSLLVSEVAISRPDGTLLALDRQRICPAGDTREVRDLLRRFPAQGAVYALGNSSLPELTEQLRHALDASPACYGGASALPNGCGAYLRVLAPDGESLRAALDLACDAARWSITRRSVSHHWRK